jgi:hypothetical protein
VLDDLPRAEICSLGIGAHQVVEGLAQRGPGQEHAPAAGGFQVVEPVLHQAASGFHAALLSVTGRRNTLAVGAEERDRGREAGARAGLGHSLPSSVCQVASFDC